MATGDQRTNFTNKMDVGLDELSTYGFDQVYTEEEEKLAAMVPEDGWFGSSPVLTSPANDQITVQTGKRGTNGIGRVIETTPATAYCTAVPFPNVAAATYHVGLMWVLVPTLVESSPHTGTPFYSRLQQVVGNEGVPDVGTVAVVGTHLEMEIDGILEAGQDHSGREVIVRLATPESSVQATAIETVTVTYPAGKNKLVLSGVLGQSVPSTTNTHYTVTLLGPRIETVDLSAVSEVLYCGTVLGNGPAATPAVFDVTGATVFTYYSDLSDVLEYCPHGTMLRVAVKSHNPLDGERLIYVRDMQNGQYRFSVYDDGHFDVRNSAGGKVFGVTAAGSLEGANTTTPLPIDDAGNTALDTDYQSETLLGALNANVVNEYTSFMPLNGGYVTQNGNNVDVSQSKYIRKGVLVSNDGAVAWNGGGWAAGASNFVYVDNDGVLAHTTPAPTASNSVCLLAVVVVDGGGNITSVTDCRIGGIPADIKDYTIYVGGATGQAIHYQNLSQALPAIGAFAASYPDVAWTIKILSEVDEGALAATLDVPVDGLTIEGHSSGNLVTDPPSVKWSTAVPLLNPNGKGGLVIRGLHFQATVVAPAGTTQLIDGNVGETLTIEDCRFDGGTSFADLSQLIVEAPDIAIRRCKARSLEARGVEVVLSGTAATVVRVEDCEFERDPALAGGGVNDEGIHVEGCDRAYILRNYVEEFTGAGIFATSVAEVLDVFENHAYSVDRLGVYEMANTGKVRLVGNTIDGVTANVVARGISASADDAEVSGNFISSVDATGDYAAIEVQGDRSSVIGNKIDGCGGDGITLSSSADSEVSGNVIQNYGARDNVGDIGIYASGAGVRILSNKVSKTAGSGNVLVGIQTVGAGCLVSGNTTDGLSIVIDGDGCTVAENHTGGGGVSIGLTASSLNVCVLGNNTANGTIDVNYDGAVVSSNLIGTGTIDIDASDCSVTGNEGGAGSSIDIAGDRHTVSGNKIETIVALGDRISVNGNVVTLSALTGLNVAGDYVAVSGNDCRATRISVTGVEAAVSGNTTLGVTTSGNYAAITGNIVNGYVAATTAISSTGNACVITGNATMGGDIDLNLGTECTAMSNNLWAAGGAQGSWLQTGGANTVFAPNN